MLMSVSEVSVSRGVSRRRVLQLIESGQLQAQKLGGVWCIDSASVAKRPQRRSRPMSEKMAWAFLFMLSDEESVGVGPKERSRLRRHIEELCADPAPAQLLESWVHRRAQRLEMRCHSTVVADVRSDPRLVVSGVSDDRAWLSAGHEVEGYIRPQDVASFIADYLLLDTASLEGTQANTVLHVSHVPLQTPVPLGVVMADLADYGGSRERAMVETLLNGRTHS